MLLLSQVSFICQLNYSLFNLNILLKILIFVFFIITIYLNVTANFTIISLTESSFHRIKSTIFILHKSRYLVLGFLNLVEGSSVLIKNCC